MRVGVLEILALPSRHPADNLYHLLIARQFASITPQAISVWCRRLGHETFYATYNGRGEPHRLLPSELDVVFIASYTQASPIAYALGRLYGTAGVLTVIGGPHATAFPVDCLRFFDIVVKECDEILIGEILAGHVDPGSLVSSNRPFRDVPSVEERMPEIRASAFFHGRRHALATIPMLASVGCPYRCNFCSDWDQAYRGVGVKDVDKRAYVQKGLTAIDHAIELKPDYVEALVYKNLLLRSQALLEKDPAKQQSLIKQADSLRDKAEAIRKQKATGVGD